jgi:YD repeat-containing protein
MTRTALSFIFAFLLLFASPASEASGITYTYDALGRVLTATYDNGTKSFYNYDAAGNRTTQGVVCSPSGC